MTPERQTRKAALRALLVARADRSEAPRSADPVPRHGRRIRTGVITAIVAAGVVAASVLALHTTVDRRHAAGDATSAPATSSPTFNADGPRDLNAICSMQSEIETVVIWRQQQTEAGRLTASQSSAVLQSIAVLYLNMPGTGAPASLQDDVTSLAAAAGMLERPTIDLTSPAVRRAQDHIVRTCQSNGLTIGALAQGG